MRENLKLKSQYESGMNSASKPSEFSVNSPCNQVFHTTCEIMFL